MRSQTMKSSLFFKRMGIVEEVCKKLQKNLMSMIVVVVMDKRLAQLSHGSRHFISPINNSMRMLFHLLI